MTIDEEGKIGLDNNKIILFGFSYQELLQVLAQEPESIWIRLLVTKSGAERDLTKLNC